MHRLLLISIVVILTFTATPVAAQTPSPTPNSDCKVTDVIKQAAALKPSGNADKDLDALLNLEDAINAARAACRGLLFKGTQVAKIVGPITLDSGTYKVTLTTKGYFIGNVKVKEGDCGFDGTYIYNVSSGEADTGRELLLDSKGCKFYLTPDNISAPWKLTFELLQ